MSQLFPDGHKAQATYQALRLLHLCLLTVLQMSAAAPTVQQTMATPVSSLALPQSSGTPPPTHPRLPSVPLARAELESKSRREHRSIPRSGSVRSRSSTAIHLRSFSPGVETRRHSRKDGMLLSTHTPLVLVLLLTRLVFYSGCFTQRTILAMHISWLPGFCTTFLRLLLLLHFLDPFLDLDGLRNPLASHIIFSLRLSSQSLSRLVAHHEPPLSGHNQIRKRVIGVWQRPFTCISQPEIDRCIRFLVSRFAEAPPAASVRSKDLMTLVHDSHAQVNELVLAISWARMQGRPL